jgi:hypothetical protein
LALYLQHKLLMIDKILDLNMLHGQYLMVRWVLHWHLFALCNQL